MMGIVGDMRKRVQMMDAFPKTMDDFKVQTASGGVVSLVSLSVIVVLVISELLTFLTPERRVELSVDVSRGEKLRVYVDIDFPRVNCEVLGIDALDATGNVQLEISNNLRKHKLLDRGVIRSDGMATRKVAVADPADPNAFTSADSGAGQQQRGAPPLPQDYCGTCYGAGKDGQCCNTCDDVVNQYREKGWSITDLSVFEQCVRGGNHTNLAVKLRPGEGCRIEGYIEVAKVAGNFHISPGHTFSFNGRHLHDMSAFLQRGIDLSHTINHLSFGESFPGAKNPLDGVSKQQDELGMYEYFVKVVPTTFQGRFSSLIKTNQFSVTEFFRPSDPAKGGQLLPGVFIFYDLSPITVQVEERRRSFFHFIVQLCAIVGGVYTVSGMLDSSLYHLPKMMKKRNVGKLI
ncbi:Endoplasmic reticulum-Golgi intermediate compartment protein 3 [Porphyridium purpureum]|uniref:Endoplasmic reticulum-Golgi intermediate compartment protein 3 n=1 Tax=Porphyridium purpureum TaxID=35688 RepID=A0A5J4YNB5_PORPP|nr:Endoplasmic reticulum-Golgi intermediate compartment protein 3 [Porphyridium purpureum]|eukprot:POR3927..scf222_8